MPFGHCDDMIQQIASATLDPSLREAVLPRTLERGPHRVHLQGSNRNGNLDSIFAITVEDEKSRSRFKRKRLPQLLNDPQTRRVLRDVEVQDPPTVVAEHEEAVENSKGDRGNSEEIHRRDGFPMIAQKGEPAFGPFGISRCSFHPARNSPLGKIETQHEKLPVDARRSPGRILGNHPEDQLTNFLRSWSSPGGLSNS